MLSVFKMAVKLLCGFVLALVLLEFSLHVCFVSPDQRSYDRFLADVRSQSCKLDINKTIFFVGDSTIYGIGTTDQHLYPLPAQFERLLKSHDPAWSCINLGRPSSPTDFHLQVLSNLPDGAIVVYRGGFVDKWYFDGKYSFYLLLGSRVYEFRTIKMLVMLFGDFVNPREPERRKKLFAEFMQIFQRKNLRIFVLGYSVHDDQEHSVLGYCDKSAPCPVPSISLRQILSGSEFVDKKGLLLPKFRNSAGSHPNDAGYYIEAKMLFNWFCRHNQLNLHPQMCLEEDNIQEYMENQERRYLEACAELKLLTEEDFRQLRFGPKAGMMVHNLHQLLNLFKDYKGFEKYQRDYELVERLVSRLFYNNPCVAAYLLESYFISMGMSEYSGVLLLADKLKLFFAVLQVSQPPDSEYRLLVEEKIRASNFPGHDLKIDFFLDTVMYPLELCPRFIEQTGISSAELSAKEAWEYFFNIPYSAFSNSQMPDSCRI